jgi:hypothetical protein
LTLPTADQPEGAEDIIQPADRHGATTLGQLKRLSQTANPPALAALFRNGGYSAECIRDGTHYRFHHADFTL